MISMDFVNNFRWLMLIKSRFESDLKWFQTESQLDRISLAHTPTQTTQCFSYSLYKHFYIHFPLFPLPSWRKFMGDNWTCICKSYSSSLSFFSFFSLSLFFLTFSFLYPFSFSFFLSFLSRPLSFTDFCSSFQVFQFLGVFIDHFI